MRVAADPTRRSQARGRLCAAGLLLAAASAAGDRAATSDLDGSTSRAAVCFAPGTSPEYVRRIHEHSQSTKAPAGGALPVPSFRIDAEGEHWAVTATDGFIPAPRQGKPITLTWSVVPDGTPLGAAQVPGESTGPSNLRAFLNGIYGSEATWRPLLQQEFDRWGARTGVHYVFLATDDGAPLPGSPGTGTVRGDVRLGGRSIDGNSNVLAYNFFPDSGDMVLDTGDSFYSNTNNNSRRLRNVVAHEHGHGLGIEHVCPVNQTKLMEPFLSTAFEGPQHDDILAGQRGYGDDNENDDTFATARPVAGGPLGDGPITLSGMGSDDNSDVDFFSFSVPANKRLDLRLVPVGFTYLEGPQNANGSCSAGTNFNSRNQSRLGVQLYAADQTTILRGTEMPALGVEGTFTDQPLPGGGTFYLRVYSASGTDQIQLYDLELTIGSEPFDLSITKTNGQAVTVPGTVTTYTIVATNPAAVAVPATIVDTFPAALTGVTWTCTASAGGDCGASPGTGNINRAVTIGPAGTVTFTATGTVNPAATGTLANTATVSSAVADPNPANNTSTDTDTLAPSANLAITKTDGAATAVPGTSVTYTIAVSNAGPSTATGAMVSDTFPGAITGVTWTCAATAGSACPASGTGNISHPVTVAPGGTLTYTATGTISPSATGTLSNTATVTHAADPNTANNTATDVDTLTPQADLSVTKTNGTAITIPGTVTTYTITVASLGPSSATGARVVDNFPAAVTSVSWTCAGTGGGSCGSPSGNGNIDALVTLPPGGSATFTAAATISPAATGTLTNTAGVTPPAGTTDPTPANASATDSDTLTPSADVTIDKTDGVSRVQPGQPLTYTITVHNVGPSNSGATVTDTFPAAFTGPTWTCAGAGGGSCQFPGGSGNVGVIVTLPAGGTATITATGTVSPAATGLLVNTASAATSVADPEPSNNEATDVDNLTLDLVELMQGTTLVRSLAGAQVPGRHEYWILQKPRASYEVVVDEASGDVQPLALERRAAAGTLVQVASGASTLGRARTLRWRNDGAAEVESELIRVTSGGCTTGCGADDTYRIRAYETTGFIPRFNNAGAQVTVLVLQNSGNAPVQGRAWFWTVGGALAGTHNFALPTGGTLVLNTKSVAGLESASGTITVTHDAPYGVLAGKTVALDPVAGFSFDTPMVFRRR